MYVLISPTIHLMHWIDTLPTHSVRRKPENRGRGPARQCPAKFVHRDDLSTLLNILVEKFDALNCVEYV